MADGVNVASAKRMVRKTRGGQFLPRDDEAPLLADGERPEQYTLDEREHQRRSGDAERQRQYRQRREQRLAAQRPEGDADVTATGRHPFGDARLTQPSQDAGDFGCEAIGSSA